MELQYTIIGREAWINKVLDPEKRVVIPETEEGFPVTALDAYALSGSQIEEVRLPSRLKKIGAYGFYGCESLRRIYCHSRIMDLGTGLFADAVNVAFLDIVEHAGEPSCFKDLLSELRQTLRVRVHRVEPDTGEEIQARLIFPEYYEEWVENTPARILFTETHGCGHRYRYCFVRREFQYQDYDALFAHVKVQEAEELAAELAMGRLLYPAGLTQRHKAMYQEYLQEHWLTAGKLLIQADGLRPEQVTNLDGGCLPWLVEEILGVGRPGKAVGTTRQDEPEREKPGQALDSMEEQLKKTEALVDAAQRAGDTEMVSWLMNCRYRLMRENGGAGEKRHRFEL